MCALCDFIAVHPDLIDHDSGRGARRGSLLDATERILKHSKSGTAELHPPPPSHTQHTHTLQASILATAGALAAVLTAAVTGYARHRQVDEWAEALFLPLSITPLSASCRCVCCVWVPQATALSVSHWVLHSWLKGAEAGST